MDIRTASGTVNSSQILASTSGQKLNIPVSPAMSPYAQFKHVRGVPDFSQKRAVPVQKLQVLNNIIDSLHKLKSQRKMIPVKQEDGLSDKAIDAMINQFSSQLHQALTKTPPVFAGNSSSTGMAFSLTV